MRNEKKKKTSKVYIETQKLEKPVKQNKTKVTGAWHVGRPEKFSGYCGLSKDSRTSRLCLAGRSAESRAGKPAGQLMWTEMEWAAGNGP